MNQIKQKILQAVKKTQTKLINKDIQEIQVRMNISKTITQVDKQDNKWIIDASIDIDKIEQNQKDSKTLEIIKEKIKERHSIDSRKARKAPSTSSNIPREKSLYEELLEIANEDRND